MKKYCPVWLIFIFILVLFLRLPSFFDPYSYGDEGIYLTLGEAARQGLVWYRDIYDNKPPLLYLLAAISGSLFWFRFILFVWNLATIYLFYLLTETLFPKNPKLNKAIIFVFALCSSLPLLEGNIANAEIFMILPIIAGVLLFSRSLDHKPQTYLGIGALFSLAALFKIPASFDFLAILVFLFFFIPRKKSLFLLALGFWVPILLTIFYYFTQGGLIQYLTAAFGQNIPYLSSWEGSSSGLLTSGVVRRGILLLLGVGFIWLLRKKWAEKISFLFFWFLFALFGATLSGRPYPHYLIQILPPTILLLALFVTTKTWPKLVASLFLGLLVLLIIYLKFWSYPTLSYYQNFTTFALGQKSKEEYFQGFGGKVSQTYKVAEFLTTHTNPGEKVFIWGDSPVVYALARRLPVGRYTVSYHIIDFNGYEEVIKKLNSKLPRYIIDLQDEPRPFPELEQLLTQKYLFVVKIDQALVYHLAPTSLHWVEK